MYLHTDTKAFLSLVTFSTGLRAYVTGVQPHYYRSFLKPAFVYSRCSGEFLSINSFSTIALYFYWCFNFQLSYQLSINEILNKRVFPAATRRPFPWSGKGLCTFHFSLLHFYCCFNTRCFSTNYRNTFNINYGSEASICLFPCRGENC